MRTTVARKLTTKLQKLHAQSCSANANIPATTRPVRACVPCSDPFHCLAECAKKGPAMTRSHAICIALTLSATLTHAQTLPVSSGPRRDWQKYPAILSIPASPLIYAVGDPHADYDRLAQLLTAAKIIEPSPAAPTAARWKGGAAVLVCTGDLIDKYNQSLAVISLLRTLQEQAQIAGGRVIVTLGNHEAEFLASSGTDKKSADFISELTAAHIVPADVALGRDSAGIGAWLRNLPAGAKVGNWFFCHAGNTGGATLANLDKAIETAVDANGWNTPVLIDANSMLEARMHPRQWWDWNGRDPQLETAPAVQRPADAAAGKARLQRLIEALGAKHLVFGHQPGKIKFLDGTERAKGQMYTKFDGLVFLIDTGLSRGVQAGRAAVLQIDSNPPRATALYIDGATETLWPR